MPDYLIACLFVLNILSFVICGLDKHYAKTKKNRIPERTLLLLSFLFGGFGFLTGMVAFRHKTQHWKFIILVPIFCIFQIFVVLLAIKYNVI